MTTATGISALALAVSLWQGWISREHNRLSVKPYVQVTPYLEGANKRIGLYISNYGLGPAVIEKASLSLDGKSYDLTQDIWQTALKNINIDDLCFKKSWLPIDSILSNGEEISLLNLSETQSPSCLIEAINLMSNHNITITLKYKSLYEESLSKSYNPMLPNVGHDILRALNRINP